MVAIDPGVSGGIAAGNAAGDTSAFKMPGTDREIVDSLKPGAGFVAGDAYLEATVKYTGVNMPSSAGISYGDSCGFIRGVLTAFGYRIVIVPPKKWQAALGLGKREKNQSKTEWKNKLKNRAEQLFPDIKVTLATADALLILEAARRGLIG